MGVNRAEGRKGRAAFLCGKGFLLCVLVLLLLLPAGLASASTLKNWKQYEQPDGGTKTSPFMWYWVYEPEDLRPGLPLVVYLHSSNGLKKAAMRDMLPWLINENVVKGIDAIILVPQLPGDYKHDTWDETVDSVNAVVEKVMDQYEVDRSRISLTGFSLGGIGMWHLAAMAPGRYARLMCICGKVEEDFDPALFEGCEIRVYSSIHDKKGNPASSEDFVKKLANAGIDATYELCREGHKDVADRLYRETEVHEWLWIIPDVHYSPVVQIAK